MASPGTTDFVNAAAAAAQGNFVQAGVDAIEGLFADIGRGRNTANEIVPTQNKVGNALTQINRMIDIASMAQLQQLMTYTQQIGQMFSTFLQNVLHGGGDSRAVQQAYETIFPLIDGSDGNGSVIRQDGGTEGSIARQIVAHGGQYQPPQLMTGFGSNIPSLQSPGQTFPWFPQAGTLPTVSPLSPLSSVPVVSVSSGLDPFTMIALAAVAFFAFGRRG